MSHKTWHFTINNYTEADIQWCHNIADDVNRITVSKEIGEGGTPHLQGRITFKNSKRLNPLKKLHNTAHWSSEMVSDSVLYCLKNDSEIIIDQKNSKQGERTDLQKACESVAAGASIRDMYMQHPTVMVRYGRGIKDLHTQLNPILCKSKFTLNDFPWTPITDWSTSHLIVGPAGCGKTEFAKCHFENPLFVTHMDDLLNFVTEVHDGIIFDDMSFAHLPRNTQIFVTDVDNARSIHCRYSPAHIPANTRKIFTSNVLDIFDFNDDAIKRRVTVTKVCDRDRSDI